MMITQTEVVQGIVLPCVVLTDDGRPRLMPCCSFKTTDADSGKFRTTAKGLPKPLVKLKSILVKGLETTASWSPIAVAYNWVHQAAKILDNKPGFELLCVFALNV